MDQIEFDRYFPAAPPAFAGTWISLPDTFQVAKEAPAESSSSLRWVTQRIPISPLSIPRRQAWESWGWRWARTIRLARPTPQIWRTRTCGRSSQMRLLIWSPPPHSLTAILHRPNASTPQIASSRDVHIPTTLAGWPAASGGAASELERRPDGAERQPQGDASTQQPSREIVVGPVFVSTALGCAAGTHLMAYRGSSLTRKRTPPGPYRRHMTRVPGGS